MSRTSGVTRIGFVEFVGCRDQSAVVVDRAPGNSGDLVKVAFTEVNFIRNGEDRAFIHGGAVRAEPCQEESCPQGLLRFAECLFMRNRAMYGGAIHVEDWELRVQRSQFIENEADLSGGAIYAFSDAQTELTINRSTFEANVAHGDQRVHGLEESVLLETSNQTLATVGMGGAVFAFCPLKALIADSTFKRNQGCRGAGGIGVVHDGEGAGTNVTFGFTVADSSFEENSAFCIPEADVLRQLNHIRGTGGAVMSMSLGYTVLDWHLANSTLIGNRATRGGAVYVSSTVFSTAAHNIESCTFERNEAVTYGGAMAAVSAHLVMMGSRVRACKAVYGGGIMAWTEAILDVVPDPRNPKALSHIENCVSYYGAGIHAALTGR